MAIQFGFNWRRNHRDDRWIDKYINRLMNQQMIVCFTNGSYESLQTLKIFNVMISNMNASQVIDQDTSSEII